MKTFLTKKYEIGTTKMNGKEKVCFALISDLHGIVYGENHRDLLEAVRAGKPDAVLAAGDMIVRSDMESLRETARLFQMLSDEYPVYYALGNHEYKLFLSEEHREDYRKYERHLTDAGVCFLHNECTGMNIRGSDFIFYGLELPLEYYRKPKSPKLSLADMEKLIGTPYRDGIHVLLAHNPKYGKTYFSWGADLTVCGHYHGGVVRFTEHCGLTCPQFLLFPPYCCGDFHEGEHHMIVSAGLGEHTVPVRIHNPRELLLITCGPLQEQG